MRLHLVATSVALSMLGDAKPSEVNRRAMDPLFRSPEKRAEYWNSPDRDAWQKPEQIIAAAKLAPGNTVVDLGAGTGYLLDKLLAAVGPEGEVLAIDTEPKMVRYLEEAIAKQAWTNVKARLGAHDDPKLAAGSVDVIVTLNTWHHIEHREDFARKLRRALKPHGRVVVVDYRVDLPDRVGPPPRMRIAANQVATELRDAGMSATVIEEELPRHYIVVAEALNS